MPGRIIKVLATFFLPFPEKHDRCLANVMEILSVLTEILKSIFTCQRLRQRQMQFIETHPEIFAGAQDFMNLRFSHHVLMRCGKVGLKIASVVF